MAEKEVPKDTYTPGDGFRSIKTTRVFRAVNYELYAKPNLAVMIVGLMCLAGSAGYIYYMRTKYESQGYYVALKGDGQEEFIKKKSKWE